MGKIKFIDNIILQTGKKPILWLSLTGLILATGTAIYTINKNIAQQQTTEPVVTTTPIQAVTALGRIEPEGEIINLSPPPDLGGAKIAQLLVKQGDLVTKGQIIALLDNQQRAASAVELARQEVKVAEANLAVIKAGAKTGDINAQEAAVRRTQAQLKGEIAANDAQVARLQAQLQSEIAERQATRDRLEAELRNAESEFQRYQNLAQQGVISDSELDSRRLAVDTAQKALAEAKASYNKTLNTLNQEIKQAQAIAQQNKDTLQQQIQEAKAILASVSEVRNVDVLQAQAEVDRAVAALKQAEEDLELTSVKAPMDGQIIKIHAYPGELVDQTLGVVEMGQTDRMVVVAEVYESDISKVKLGQTATVRSETGSFSGELTGTVSKVGLKIGKQDVLSTDPAADVDSRVVEVEISLDSEASQKVAHLTNSKAIVKINL